MSCQASWLAAASTLSGPSQDDFWLCELGLHLQGRAQEGLNNLVLLDRHGEQVDLLQGLDLALQPGAQTCAGVLHFTLQGWGDIGSHMRLGEDALQLRPSLDVRPATPCRCRPL